MAPPVALLIYVPDEPARAAFYPFARFSPEWRAIRYALEHDVPVRFMDLPAANKMADRGDDEPRRGLRADPLAALAEVAGHGDPERWWEDVVESRREGDAFEAVDRGDGARCARRSRSTTTRRGAPRGVHAPVDPRRQARQARRTSPSSAAPGTRPRSPSSAPRAPDQRTLKGLPKVKVAATWVPWTYGLLARDSGYGAGVDSPAWYDQLFDEADDPIARWLGRAARLLRERRPRRVRRAGGRRRAAGDARWPASATARWRGSTSCSTRPAPCSATAADVPLALVRARAGRRPRGSARSRTTRRWCRSSRTSRACSGGCG